MEQQEPQYQSYLLRLWRSGTGETWRVMLECVGTRERHGFADLGSLCVFLQEEMNDKEKRREECLPKSQNC
jgi:hypothetical protein